MRVGILVTNGGPHSAETLAAATAGQLIEISASAAGEQELAGRRLENKFLDILENHHQTIQDRERANPSFGELNPNIHVSVDTVVNELVEAGKASKWSEHFSDPSVVDYIRQIVTQDFATSMQTERFWHADKNPDNVAAVTYKQSFHG